MLLLLVAAACTSSDGVERAAPISCRSGTASGQGSSAQANAVSSWIREYQVACADATVEYASIGSGDGLAAFIAGTGDFAGSDSPLGADDQPEADARCGSPAIHLPMVAGPIAIAYNVAGVDDLQLAPGTIAAIFAGRITDWDDPLISRDNPDTALPASPIVTVHRSDRSGTTDNFTRFLDAAAGPDWPHGSGGEWAASGGVGRDGSTGMVDEIERSDGAIGYVEASYADFHNLPMARIGNAAGEFVALTDDSVGLMLDGAIVAGDGGDLRLTLDYRAPVAGAYPLVLVTYEVVCQTGSPALVKSFLAYTSSPAGQEAAARLGYAPLPEALRAEVADTVAGL